MSARRRIDWNLDLDADALIVLFFFSCVVTLGSVIAICLTAYRIAELFA